MKASRIPDDHFILGFVFVLVLVLSCKTRTLFFFFVWIEQSSNYVINTLNCTDHMVNSSKSSVSFRVPLPLHLNVVRNLSFLYY